MKAFILSCFSRPRRLTALIVLLIGSMTPQALCQTVTWTSSHPTIVSVDNSGTIKYEQISADVQYVTITATATQNEKTVTSSKIIELNHYYPGCNSPSVYLNGIWWAVCDIGKTVMSETGNNYTWGQAQSACAVGWRLPTYLEMIALDYASGGTSGTPIWNTNTKGGIEGTLNGVKGRWYSGTRPPTASGIFFPFNGRGDSSCGAERKPAAEIGTYWTSTPTTGGWYGVHLTVGTGNCSTPYDEGTTAGSVRCVKAI